MDSPKYKVERNEPEVYETTKHAESILDMRNKVRIGQGYSC